MPMLARTLAPFAAPRPLMEPHARERSAAQTTPRLEANLRDALSRQYDCYYPQILVTQLCDDQAACLTRKFCEDDHFGHIETPAAADAYLLHVELGGGSRQLVTRGRTLGQQVFTTDSIGLRALADDHAACLVTPFDTLFIYLPRPGLEAIAQDLGTQGLSDLACTTGQVDPIVARLARTLLPALAHPENASPLFVDCLVMAIGAHVVRRYGDLQPTRVWRGGLAGWQQRRAEEILLDGDPDSVSLGELASECRLSRGYFVKAFKQTYGVTPHKWLSQSRVEKAKALLMDPKRSIADIALTCGFVDQSHMTRVFSQHMGAPPARWRRQYCN